MNLIFTNRYEAGFLLGRKLRSQWPQGEPLILALPRGGVPVGYQVALELNAPLDVFTVRKLGVPGHEELAMRAIATSGIRVMNDEVVDTLAIPAEVVDAVTQREAAELRRRELAYRHTTKPPQVKDRSVILVDDGVATGSTMLAAIKAVKREGASYVMVAAPVMARGTVSKLRKEADEVVALSTPEPFEGVGRWYQNFTPTMDDEVRELLRMADLRETEKMKLAHSGGVRPGTYAASQNQDFEVP
jgi:predicted phosphoribosyltransferase